MADQSTTAIIFGGGVAKGAFGAGAAEVLTSNGIAFCRVVGASSGALNATFLAAALRRGCIAEGAARLAQLWLDDAKWMRFLDPSARTIFGARGLSDSDRLIALIRAQIAALPVGAPMDVQLRLIVTALDGVEVATPDGPATTFEDVRRFESADFDADERLDAVIRTAAASAAFPGLFAPLALPPHGAAVDGGLVSNTPIKEAIADSNVNRVFVIVPYPQVDGQQHDYAGTQLAGRLIEILIQERLFRDLQEAADRNQGLAALTALVSGGRLTTDQLQAVLGAIGWDRTRLLQIIPIRPSKPLDGGAFSGFLHRELREVYVEQGREAARTALRRLSQPSAR
jgi:predicted acylesterase/phospholipase RssA